jgi:hypothetical protein
MRRIIALGSILILSLSTLMTQAAQIGTGTVTGSGALSAPIIWNDVFPGVATGTINGIIIKARVLPTLNMVVSTGVLDLGNLVSTSYSTGTLSIEIGTNAINGASVTARSGSGGIINTSSGSIVINSLTTDGAADSYRFASAILAATDSTVSGFTQSASLSTEVNNNSTNHALYTSNKPQSLSTGTANDDFTFSVAAQPNAQTPA